MENLQNLKNSAETYYQATGVPLAILDTQGNSLCQVGPACRYCEKIRALTAEKGSTCGYWHRHGGQQAHGLGEDYIYACPGGMILYAVFIEGGDGQTGSILAGPVLIEYPDIAMVDETLNRFQLPLSERSALFALLGGVTLVEPRRVKHLSKMLFLLTRQAGDGGDGVRRRELEQQARIAQYLQALGTHEEGDDQRELERQLRQNIQAGNREEAALLLDQLIGQMYLQTGMRPELVRVHAIERVSLLSRDAIEAGADAGEMYAVTNGSLRRLVDMGDLESISLLLQDVLSTCISLINPPEAQPASAAVAQSIKYIHQRFKADIGLEEVSRHVGLSPAYFSALFKEETGISFTAYVNRLRINTAKRLLRDTDMSLVDISLSLGFSSQSYFSSTFKRHVGKSPMQFKKGA